MFRPPPKPGPGGTHPPEIAVHVEAPQWEGTLRNAINSRNHLRILVKGQKALTARNNGFPDICKTPAPPAPPIPVPYPNLAGPLSSAGLGKLVELFGVAAAAGYKPPTAHFKPHAQAQHAELIFYVK